MPIALVIAIINLIAHLPEIVDLIKEIIDAIRNRSPLRRQALFGKLHELIEQNGSAQAADMRQKLEAFRDELAA